jgi:hypothetical protein
MGQTEITGRCNGLMCKNGEKNVVDFACAKSCLLLNLTDMRRKHSACISLHVGMVPKLYHPSPH